MSWPWFLYMFCWKKDGFTRTVGLAPCSSRHLTEPRQRLQAAMCRAVPWWKSLHVEFSTVGHVEEEEEARPLFSINDWFLANYSCGRGVGQTSGFSCFQQNTDELRHIKVRSVVQGVHVGPATPQTHISAQGDQLSGETQRCRRVTCTQRGLNVEAKGEKTSRNVEPEPLLTTRSSKTNWSCACNYMKNW